MGRTFAATSLAIASCSAAEASPEPNDMLTISCRQPPFLEEPVDGVDDILIRAGAENAFEDFHHPEVGFGLTPTTPRLLSAAAMIPPTCVPWRLSSKGTSVWSKVL